MTANFSDGVLNASSWHGLERVGDMPDADAMIAAGESSGAWPTLLTMPDVQTADGAVMCKGYRAVVGHYLNGDMRSLGVVGSRYHATTPDSWRELVRAAALAGGKPTGAFALADHTRLVATFEVGQANGLRTNLLLADAFDGSMRLNVGFTSIRVVCCNTLAAAMSSDGKGMAALRHTASLESKVEGLKDAIATSIATGEKVRETYNRAATLSMSRDGVIAMLDVLFPTAPKDAPKATITRMAENRADAVRAMSNPVNNEGTSLATVWNAATYLVDRTVGGAPRKVSGDNTRLDSMLFGARQKRVEEIREVVLQVIDRAGNEQSVTASMALDMGADRNQVGRKILEAMAEDA